MTLHQTIQHLFSDSKGILAADESNKSAQKRFNAAHIACTPKTRRDYRELLMASPNLSDYISGVILFDETFWQKTESGKSFPAYLKSRGILPGIKVDKGLVELDNFPGEQITEGLDGLGGRLKSYHDAGASFAKWRAVFAISRKTPTDAAINANSHLLARYAALCQSHDIVPILEPEVLYDGSHSLEAAEATMKKVFSKLFEATNEYKVDLSGVILKTSMALSGKNSAHEDTPEAVATVTLRAFQEVPKDIGGIVFLSGGQKPLQATRNFSAIVQASRGSLRPLTFSFSRAVQDPALKVWSGHAANVESAQKIFVHRVRMNALARAGRYDASAETADLDAAK